jgi:hypothetical protein
VEPELNAEIEYRAKSAEGKVRHPFFKGLREDLQLTSSIATGNGRTSRSDSLLTIPVEIYEPVMRLGARGSAQP